MKLLLLLAFIFTLHLVFTLDLQAQRNQYPNELKGYQFFGKGKLKRLRLGTSTKEDVKKIFGKQCENYCDYNQNWMIRFDYIQEDNCYTVTSYPSEQKQKFCPTKEFIGKLHSVKLSPKRRIPFAHVSFANLGVHMGGSICSFGSKGGGMTTSYHSFGDGDGLTYSIFDEVTLTTEKKPFDKKKGDLLSIEYELPEKLTSKIFLKQQ